MDQVIVARHGTSVAVADGIQNGDPDADAGLTAIGEDEARNLGHEIALDPIDLCVTSRFPRTQQTALLALAGRRIDCVVDPNLDDIRTGAFEGQPVERYRAWTRAHDLATPLPGGESRLQVAARLCTAFSDVCHRPEHCALVVTHELLIADLLSAIREQHPGHTHADIPYASPYRLAATDVMRGVTFLRSWLEG